MAVAAAGRAEATATRPTGESSAAIHASDRNGLSDASSDASAPARSPSAHRAARPGADRLIIWWTSADNTTVWIAFIPSRVAARVTSVILVADAKNAEFTSW